MLDCETFRPIMHPSRSLSTRNDPPGFRCDNTGGTAKTFAEQVDGLTAAHARLTPGLKGTLTQIGVALTGRAGSRLAQWLGSRRVGIRRCGW